MAYHLYSHALPIVHDGDQWWTYVVLPQTPEARTYVKSRTWGGWSWY